MLENASIQGLVTAVLTPLDRCGKPDLNRFTRHVRTLEQDGSDCILIAGTTGEGPSFSAAERRAVLEASLPAAGRMQVIAQTGCASLTDTIQLTQHAFELGLKAVTVLPPFFFKEVSEDGLFTYYQQVLDEAVPPHGKLMLYHIPQVTQVPITFRLVERLLEKNGERIAGIKDSTGDLDHLREYCERFPELSIFTGNDQLVLPAMQVGAAGCVTGVVNIFASLAAAIIQSFRRADPGAVELQQLFTRVWKVLETHQPYTTLLKALLALRYEDPGWMCVRPPLEPMPFEQLNQMVSELRQIELPEIFDWIRKTDTARLVAAEIS